MKFSLIGKTREKSIAVAKARSDQTMKQNESRVDNEGGAETINITQMKVGRQSNAIGVRLKRKLTVKDDTQTLNPRGKRNRKGVNGKCKIGNFGKGGFGAYKE